eukprot:255758_1
METLNDKNETIDLEIFREYKHECNGHNKCSYLSRMICALRYYQLQTGTTFIEFCVDVYGQQCLDDYIHFICNHINNINQLNNNNCKCTNITRCKFRTNHLRKRNEAAKNSNEKYNFYIDIFDSIHFCLFHLKDTGFRMQINDTEDQNDLKRQNDLFGFHRLQKPIRSKFIIQQSLSYGSATKAFKNTFAGKMIRHIQKDIYYDVSNNLTQFLLLEEYDTDSIMNDLLDIFDEDGSECNILRALNRSIEALKEIISLAKTYTKYKSIS